MTDDHDADRLLQISLSKNGAHTFGDPRFYDLPETGDFKKKIRASRWGQLTQGVLKIETTSPVDVTLIALSIDAS